MRLRTLVKNTIAAILIAMLPLPIASAATSPAAAAAAQAQKIANLQTKGAAEIDRRVANLSAALEKLGASTKLSLADKASLTAQVQSELTGLASLKAKLAADTTLTAARADVASIVTEYRVYVLMLPKARLAAAADRFAIVEDKLTSLNAKLTAAVDQQKTAGKDVSALEAKLSDMKSQTAAATSATQGLVAKLIALQPTDYNTSHAVLVTYRESLKTAQTDAVAARDDAKSVIDGLKALK